MIGDLKVLAVISARGGSKRLPRKNVLELAGRPLIGWTIEAARAARRVDRVVLSSEDAEIMRVAKSLGCEVPFTRPAELATDAATGVAPVLDALERLPGYEMVVLLQPTSPLRSAADIDACVEACAAEGASSCVSVTPVAKNPYWMYRLDAARRMSPLLADAEPGQREPLYVLNGAVYAARSAWLAQHQTFVGEGTVAHVMPPERSVDIDERSDFEFAQFLLQRN